MSAQAWVKLLGVYGVVVIGAQDDIKPLPSIAPRKKHRNLYRGSSPPAVEA